MTPTIRSASGALLMLAMIPAIVGLLACLPVPIGDPERSRVDPDISGIWVWLDGESAAAFYAFEPYDKRTWLLTGVGVEEADGADFSDYDLSDYAGLGRLMESVEVGDGGATATSITLYKAWRTKLGGKWFMTWEPKAVFDNEEFAPDAWMGFRIDRPDVNTMELFLIDDKLFKDVEKSRRAYERVIKKNVNNTDLYLDEPIRMVRLNPAHRAFVDKLTDEVIDE